MDFLTSCVKYTVQNPITEKTLELSKYVVNGTLQGFGLKEKQIPPPTQIIQTVECNMPLWRHARGGRAFLQLAGLSGAAAVALGAYGSHVLYPKDIDEDLKKIFEMANRYHFMHTVALLGVPLCRFPKLTGSCFVVGMTLFSGTCYYHAFTGDKQFRYLTPAGGCFLILGWLCLVL